MSSRILIIEDEVNTSKYLARALETEGFEVDCAEDGKTGIQKLKTNQYELIVLDLKMPGKNGDEVLEEIRRLDPLIQVVVYTNYEQAPVMQKLINLGVEGYIKKGTDADLWETVKFIKSKIFPLEPSQEKEMLKKIFNKINEREANEIYA